MNENSSVKKSRKVRNMSPKWDRFFVQKCVFLTPLSRPRPKRVQGRPGLPKSSIFHQNLSKKVTQKLTHLSSLCSLRNICGELGGSNMAPSFAHYVLSFFLLNLWGEQRSCTFCTFLGVRQCHAARRLQYNDNNSNNDNI